VARWTGGRALVVASAVVASGGVAGGHGTPPVTSCGIPYTFTFQHRAPLLSGSCAGLLPPSPPRVLVTRGRTFSLRIVHEQNGRLDFPIPTPTTGAACGRSETIDAAGCRSATTGATCWRSGAIDAVTCGSLSPA